MLSGLAGFLKPSLELSGPGRNDQNCQVCLSGSLDHVLNVIFVARTIQDCESSLFGLKVGLSHFNRNRLFPFLFVLVHQVRSPPPGPALSLGLLFELLDLHFVDDSGLDQKLSGNGRFSRIDVSDHYHDHWTLFGIENVDFLNLCRFEQFLQIKLLLWSPLYGSGPPLPLEQHLDFLFVFFDEFLLQNVRQVLLVDEGLKTEQIVDQIVGLFELGPPVEISLGKPLLEIDAVFLENKVPNVELVIVGDFLQLIFAENRLEEFPAVDGDLLEGLVLGGLVHVVVKDFPIKLLHLVQEEFLLKIEVGEVLSYFEVGPDLLNFEVKVQGGFLDKDLALFELQFDVHFLFGFLLCFGGVDLLGELLDFVLGLL